MIYKNSIIWYIRTVLFEKDYSPQKPANGSWLLTEVTEIKKQSDDSISVQGMCSLMSLFATTNMLQGIEIMLGEDSLFHGYSSIKLHLMQIYGLILN